MIVRVYFETEDSPNTVDFIEKLYKALSGSQINPSPLTNIGFRGSDIMPELDYIQLLNRRIKEKKFV